MSLRFALTGATGLLGSNVLWEIIKRHISDLESLKIFILGRGKKKESLRERILSLLLSNGLTYITDDLALQNDIKNLFDKICVFVDYDLTNSGERVASNLWSEMRSAPIDFFYHIGANTDLRGGALIEASLLRTNIQGTQNILHLVSELQVGTFCYTGTAYSCGCVGGMVEPDFINVDQIFRNPYEETKLLSEVIVREYAKQRKMRVKFFRPSVISGRLIEQPLGCVTKFDVFYGWAAFFLAMKKKDVPDISDLFEKRVNFDIRLCYSMTSGLNIVPVDFVAKALYLLTVFDHPAQSYHLVSRNELPHRDYIPAMLKVINVGGIQQVGRIPSGMNSEEKLYYRTAGKILTPYITSEPINFLVSNYDDFILKHGLEVPSMSIERFSKLFSFAKQHYFGIV
jgi:nucleoside-diphosphate-sugar epimerase